MKGGDFFVSNFSFKKKTLIYIILLLFFSCAQKLPSITDKATSNSNDGYEPDDSFEAASLITLEETQERSISSEDDIDYIKISSEKYQKYLIKLEDNSGNVSGCFFSNSIPILFKKNIEFIGDEKDWFISIMGTSELSDKIIGSYSISLLDNGVIPDSYEDDNSNINAKEIKTNELQKRTIHSSNDIDFIKFNSQLGKFYKISLSNFNNSIKADIYDYTNAFLGVFKNYSVIEGNGNEFYIKVSYLSKTVVYTTKVEETIPDKDSYESDDSFTSAKEIKVGETQSRTIHSLTDMDYIKLSTTTVHKYKVVLSSSNINLTPEIYDSFYAYGGSFNSTTFINGNGGNFYIKVKGDSIGDYTIKLEEAGFREDSYESDNNILSAKEVSVGQTQLRTIHSSDQSECDYIKFYREPGKSYKIVLSNGSSAVEADIIDNSSTNKLNYFKKAAIIGDYPGDGYWHVKVYSPQQKVGTYYITLYEISSPEPDDSVGSAFTIGVGELLLNNIRTSGTTYDWIKIVNLRSGKKYLVSCIFSETFSLLAKLYPDYLNDQKNYFNLVSNPSRIVDGNNKDWYIKVEANTFLFSVDCNYMIKVEEY